MFRVALNFVLLTLLSKADATVSSSIVSNALPRLDSVTGEILDIHDGTTIRIGDTFFWYGAGYGQCVEQSSGCASGEVGKCGFNLNHTVNLATSTDLVNWTLAGTVLSESARPSGILYSPWVALSTHSKKFVMWFNLLPVKGGSADFYDSYYAVAEADSPYGPFVLVAANISGIAYTQLPDAPALFVDDDGSGYLAFTHEGTHVNTVQQLTSDLHGPLPGGKISPIIGEPNNEGIFMFKRSGIYYVGFGTCCCFCEGGTNVILYSAPAPLGPYTAAGELAVAADWGAQTGTVWFTGQDWVLFGDRWQSAPDHIKAHDFSYMAPVQFAGNGSVLPLPGWQDSVTIQY